MIHAMSDHKAEHHVVQVFEKLWAVKTPESLAATYTNPPERIRELTQAFEDWNGKKVLEIGSGSGLLAIELARRGAKMTLLDGSPAALKISRSVFQGIEAEFIQGDMFALPFEGECFDFVYSAGVVEHYPPAETEQAIREHARVARRGGKVLVMVPSSRGRIYRLGKILLEHSGRWRVGYERPIRSLATACPELLLFEREYQTEVFSQTDFVPRMMRGPLLCLLRWLTRNDTNHPLAIKILGGRILHTWFVRR
jgi:ubiquinone/menaquinone biosynthesis C-methylase UbiE